MAGTFQRLTKRLLECVIHSNGRLRERCWTRPFVEGQRLDRLFDPTPGELVAQQGMGLVGLPDRQPL
jgi:hypothetical protein